jgi:plastocyanin
VLEIKVGDTVRWVNEDWNSVSLRSPPYVGGGSNVTLSDLALILDGMNFDEYIEPGKTLSIQFTRPGGFHYQYADVAGTIIVEER